MHLLLMSGGSGKRLWPLSNDTRSKQFIKILKSPDGTSESMLQRIFRQMENVGGWDSVTISASASHKEQIELQLADKDINLVIEPERRNTFPAIALACAYLKSEKGISRDEPIAILPVDTFVDQPFFNKVSMIEGVLQNNDANLVLIGALPHFPTEKYGYIVPFNDTLTDEVCKVEQFKEKPNRDTAVELLKRGALWNCGVFGLKLGYVLDILESKLNRKDLCFSYVLENFSELHATSFDYEVVEKADRIYTIKYTSAWKDLGTWETFTEVIEDKVSGDAILDEESKNTHVINEMGIPLVVLGIDNAVVVANRDGILVAEKGKTPLLKNVVSKINNRPMYEEKRWGYYSVLEHVVFDGDKRGQLKCEAITKKMHLIKGKQISYQYHYKRKEVWTIIQGTGMLFLEDETQEVSMGQVIVIEPGMKHGLKAITDMDIIEVQLGSPLVEEEIVRLEMEW